MSKFKAGDKVGTLLGDGVVVGRDHDRTYLVKIPGLGGHRGSGFLKQEDTNNCWFDESAMWMISPETLISTSAETGQSTEVENKHNIPAQWGCMYDNVSPADIQRGAIKQASGGSTPNQYRIPINLPLTEDRTKFVDVDLEAMDVIDGLDLSGNLKDVQKALFRMGKKDGTPESYDFNKCIFFLLREMKKRGIISHRKFWEATKAIDEVLSKEE